MNLRAVFEKMWTSKTLELRSGNRREYINESFKNYFLEEGIKHDPCPPHSSELNEVSEKANQTIVEKFCCIVSAACKPRTFWVDALWHIMFKFNSVSCHTPAGFNSPNCINNIPPIHPCCLSLYGCLVWNKVTEVNRRKLDPKQASSILLPYIIHIMGYHL